MPTQQSQVSYQASTFTHCIERMIARFGDCLEKLTAIDKLDLIGILSFWQSCDTTYTENNLQSIGLAEYLEMEDSLKLGTSSKLDQALEILADCSDEDALTLLVSLSCQLRDGVYGE
jgi:hypothetical protein